MTKAFLLGAGFSKALNTEMPLMNELLNDLSISEEVPIAIRTDLEQSLSYLWTNYPWKKDVEYLRDQASYLSTVSDIYRILSEMEFSAWNSLTDNNKKWHNIGWQADFAEILARKNLLVISMNYDTLLERLMVAKCDASLEYPAPLQRLNSIWNQRQQITSWGNPSGLSDLVNINGHSVHLNGSPISPQLYKLHGSLSWYSLDLLNLTSHVYARDIDQYYLTEYPRHEEEYGTLSAVIIPPVADKSSLYANKVLRSQWTSALASLLKCDEFYCVGYSFPESDLAMRLFLSRASQNLRKVYLVSRTAGQSTWDRIKNYFPPHVQHEYISGENCVEDLANTFVDMYREETKTY